MSRWKPPCWISRWREWEFLSWLTLMPFVSSLRRIPNLIVSGVELDTENSTGHEPSVSLQST